MPPRPRRLAEAAGCGGRPFVPARAVVLPCPVGDESLLVGEGKAGVTGEAEAAVCGPRRWEELVAAFVAVAGVAPSAAVFEAVDAFGLLVPGVRPGCPAVVPLVAAVGPEVPVSPVGVSVVAGALVAEAGLDVEDGSDGLVDGFGIVSVCGWRRGGDDGGEDRCECESDEASVSCLESPRSRRGMVIDSTGFWRVGVVRSCSRSW
jgi:hypothetical protein